MGGRPGPGGSRDARMERAQQLIQMSECGSLKQLGNSFLVLTLRLGTFRRCMSSTRLTMSVKSSACAGAALARFACCQYIILFACPTVVPCFVSWPASVCASKVWLACMVAATVSYSPSQVTCAVRIFRRNIAHQLCRYASGSKAYFHCDVL
jgi:hypothetical protein